jgi:hypothetical protein
MYIIFFEDRCFFVTLSRFGAGLTKFGGLPLKRASTGIMARSTAILEAGFALAPPPFVTFFFYRWEAVSIAI